MILKSYPKINLYLKIIDFDGRYHLLESRFAHIKGNLYDEIEITQSNKDIIEGDFGCKIEASTVSRALCLLREKYPKTFPPIHIKVAKKIPKGSGLGGGSSNAGCVLQGIDSMFCLGLANEELNAIAKSVGADVAFFVSGAEFAEVSGVGEQIYPLTLDLSDVSEFEIYTPNVLCDTKAVYRQYRAMIEKQILKFSHKNMLKHFSNEKLLDFGEHFEGNKDSINGHSFRNSSALKNSLACERFANISALNDLFAPACALYPQLLEIAQELGEGWFFSGSGSSFFRPILRKEQHKMSDIRESSIKSTNIDSKVESTPVNQKANTLFD